MAAIRPSRRSPISAASFGPCGADEREGGFGRFASTVEFFAHATGAGLGLSLDGEDFVEDGDVGLEGDTHERVSDGAENFLCVEGAALPDEAKGDDGVVAFGAGKALDLEGDFVGAGNADDFAFAVGEDRLGGGEERVGVLAIVFADNEGDAG